MRNIPLILFPIDPFLLLLLCFFLPASERTGTKQSRRRYQSLNITTITRELKLQKCSILASFRFATLSSLLKLKGEVIHGDRLLLPFEVEDFKLLPHN